MIMRTIPLIHEMQLWPIYLKIRFDNAWKFLDGMQIISYTNFLLFMTVEMHVNWEMRIEDCKS